MTRKKKWFQIIHFKQAMIQLAPNNLVLQLLRAEKYLWIKSGSLLLWVRNWQHSNRILIDFLSAVPCLTVSREFCWCVTCILLVCADVYRTEDGQAVEQPAALEPSSPHCVDDIKLDENGQSSPFAGNFDHNGNKTGLQNLNPCDRLQSFTC